MRLLVALALLAPLGLAACGGKDERTVVVNPPAPATVVAPPVSTTRTETTTTKTCAPNTMC